MRAHLAVATIALLLAACGSTRTRAAAPDVGALPMVDAGAEDAGVEDAGLDAGIVDAGIVDAGEDAGPRDAGPPDAGMRDAGTPDAGVDAGPMCPAPPTTNGKCTVGDTSTCPNGFCAAGLCLAPLLNGNEWANCGNGTCDQCESAQTCPADCAPAPALTGTKSYDDGTTMTVFLHGFNNAGSHIAMTTYGDISGCGDIGTAYQTFGVNAPCGDTAAGAMAPNQVVAVEYYGAIPASWMSMQDIQEIEQYPEQGGTTGLQRYALIVAKFIRHQMAVTGATHVNLACHSMGCLISRYMIENDVEQLASQNVIVRWITAAGVIAGAKLARYYNNPIVQMYATTLGLQLSDFVIMNPDFVQTYAAVYDHKLYEGNNPLFQGILIHHVGATDPRVGQAANIQLLDLMFPPGVDPNDGIMFTQDEYFASQSPAASVTTPSGQVVSATHSFVYEQHGNVPRSIGYQAIAAAGMTGRRKVVLSLQSVTLNEDREFNLTNELTEQGAAPAEVVMESTVLYDPYTMPTFNISTPVQEDYITYRSPDMYQQSAGSTMTPNQVFFAGPVFDQQNAIHLKLQLTEADLYPRFNVNEALLNTPNRPLASYEADVTLQDQMIPITSQYVNAVVQVQVVNMY